MLEALLRLTNSNHDWRHGCLGLGKAIAECLAKDGYNLVLGYSSNRQAAEATRSELEKAHGITVIIIGGDIAAPATMEALFAAVQDNFGNECTAFVHNAGLYLGVTTAVTETQPTEEDTFEQKFDYYQKVYPQAFRRGLLLAQKCTGLKHVITISAPGCSTHSPPRIWYEIPGQAKAALEFLTRLHASALARQGVNVNCVVPYMYTKTEAWDSVAKKMGKSIEELKRFADNTPAGRWCDPTEIANVVAFLCSAKGSFVTGVILRLDGGLHLRPNTAVGQ